MRALSVRHVSVVLAVATAVLTAWGCGPLVGVKATVRVDDRTRLEREVLGGRAGVGPEMVLLPPEFRAAARLPLELRDLHDRYAELEGRLAAAPVVPVPKNGSSTTSPGRVAAISTR